MNAFFLRRLTANKHEFVYFTEYHDPRETVVIYMEATAKIIGPRMAQWFSHCALNRATRVLLPAIGNISGKQYLNRSSKTPHWPTC